MRLARLSLFALALFQISARAEIYTMYTGPSSSGPNIASTFGVGFNYLDIVYIPGIGSIIGSIPTPIPNSPVNGNVTVDMNLDVSNSGTLSVSGADLQVADFTIAIPESLFIVGAPKANISFQDVRLSLQTGPIAVTNGSFAITSSTPGYLTLDAGTVDFYLRYAALGLNVDELMDLSTDPWLLPFSSLGAQVITGTVDDDLGGYDTVSASPHDGPAGSTGTSLIDTEGTEFHLDLNGIVFPSMLVQNSTAYTISIILAGSITVGVPEAGSTTLVLLGGAAFVGGLWTSRRRRG